MSVSAEDAELLELLLAEEGVAAGPRLARRAAGTPVALSYAQQRLWFLQQLDPASAAYNISTAVRLGGQLDPAALEAALNDVVARHEVLRTEFPAEDGKATVRVRANAVAVRVQWHDLAALPAAERAAGVQRVQSAEAARVFDLAVAPLVRLSVARCAPDEHVAVLTMHHIVSDGWSMEVLVRELGTAYAARASGRAPTWTELAIQYADFATWQRTWLETGVRAQQLDYWRKQLAQPPTLALPTDRPRPARPDFAGAAHGFALPADVVAGVRRLAREEDATLFMVLLAGFQVLLHRYSGQDDLVVGAPVANRTRSELEPLIGFFVNTLVLRADFSGRPDFRTLVRQAKRTALDAYAHQDVPFEDLVAELQPERQLTQNPLFQAMFSVQNAARETLRMPGLALDALKSETAVAKFDLLCAFEESAEGIFGGVEYRTALFDAATIARCAEHLVTLLRAAVQAPDTPVRRLQMMSEGETKQVLVAWNATARAYPERSIAELFAEQVRRTPEAEAVRLAGGSAGLSGMGGTPMGLEAGDFSERTRNMGGTPMPPRTHGRDARATQALTYAELEARANRLARRLRASGVGPDVCVGVGLERSLELIVTVLAIVKAGGAYVALDPEYPAARLQLMLADVGAGVVVTQEKFLARFEEASPQVEIVCVDRDAARIAAEVPDDPAVRVTLERLAYVSFTSGSTGTPKGVAVPQRGVVRLVQNTDFAAFGADEVFLQFAPVAFDASTLEIWGPLLNGGRLVVMPPGTPSLEELGRTIREEGVTTLWLTAGLFQAMADERLEDLRGVKQLLAGGDVLPVPQVRRVLQALPGCRLINGYGPTENTTFTCCHTIAEADLAGGAVPIGRPIANTRVYVLDTALQPVPVGVPGELFTGGDGLARGYVNRPELTAEKFIPDPFGAGRLYRTGDRVRWRADGTIEFLGRLDHQVKIRGYRIEPGEAEAALLAEAGVKAAVVVVREEQGRKRLVGYVVVDQDNMGGTPMPLRGEELRARLQARLPDYLVPAVIVRLDALPLTPNGKVDRAALPVPMAGADEAAGFVAPRPGVEQEIAAVWTAVLGLARVGAHDNYFASGGDSISAIQVASRLKRAGWQVDVRDLFQYATVAELAPRLKRLDAAATMGSNESVVGPVPLTPAQAWFFAQPTEQREYFNQAVLLRPRETLAADAVAAVVAELWRHHDALRTVFDGAAARIVAPEMEGTRIFAEIVVQDEAARLAHSETVQRGFDLARGPLFAVVLYRLPGGDRLLLAAHHLVVDGVSWRILLEDLELGLRQHAQGAAIDFGPKSTSIRAWVEAARRKASEHGRDAHATQKEQTRVGEFSWPEPRANAANVFGATQTLSEVLVEATTRAVLTTAHAAYHTEVNDLLLTALGRALKGWHGGEATRVTMEGHGRDPETELPALDRTVGWFTCLYPVTISVRGDDIGAQVKRVKETLRAVPAKGIGYGLKKYLGTKATTAAAPGALPVPHEAEARVSFNYLGQFGEESGGRLAFAEESTGVTIGPRVARAHELDAGAIVTRGRMELTLTFGAGRYDAAAMARLLADWRREIEGIVAHCAARTTSEKTPADFTSKVQSIDQFETMLAARDWPAAAVEDVCRLSPMQAGLLFQSVFEAGSAAYFIQMAYRLRGRLDVARLAEAWRVLGRRHSILRTSFVHRDVDEPFQLVWRERAPEVNVADLRALAPAEREARIAEARATDLARGFDLERDSLWRVSMWQTADDTFQVVWSYHHVLLDGWSLGLVHRDLLRAYAALDGGGVASLPAPAAYRDHVRWLARRDAPASRAFWTQYLAGCEQPTNLPRLHAGPEDAPFAAADHLLELGREFSVRLRAVAAQAGVTLNILLQAAWGLVLARHNRTEDVVFGTIVSGRPAELPGVEEMVGLFICAVPVRVQPRATVEFTALLRELQQAALAAEAHHHLPIAEIQTLTPLGRELFDHLLVFENYPIDRALAGGAEETLRVEGIEAHDRTHYDLDVTVDPGEAIAIKFGYNRHVYPDDQIARVAAQVRHVLGQIVARPQATLGDYALATPADERAVFEAFNATAVPWPRERTLLDLLEETARAAAGRVAVVQGATELTYAELHARANRLAQALRRRGVGPEVVVGLCVERTVEMIVAVLGILKAGGAYVPLDPLYPAERLAFMAEDAGVRVWVTQRTLRSTLPQNAGEVIVLDDGSLAAEPATSPASTLRPEHLAYVIYTSGSTGKPKGVMVEHRTLVNAAIAWRTGYGLGLETDVRLLQMASLSFDVFAGDFVRALTNGGTLVVCDAEVRVDPAGLCALLTRHRVTLFESTPGLILPLMEHVRAQRVALPELRLLILGSDTLPVAEYRRLVADFGATMRIVNSYGVTEATIDSCFFEARSDEALAGTSAPIGRPMANQRLYVVDERMRACPVGVAGELLIAGEGVARGYHARPELTAERFVTVEIGGARQRVYRTGDLARWRADGNLEFLGRGDQQVKVRGFRVEPGEIEARLRTHAGVREVVVLARTVSGANELVAYIVPAAEWTPAEWRAHVLAELPEHMAPAFWVKLERLPLSPNGKVDRRALPAPDAESGVRSAEFVAPRTPVEIALAGIWREVLQLERVGADDNFFELGGHSLKAMQVASRVQQALGVRPGLREFFAAPSIAGLARLVEGANANASDPDGETAGDEIPRAPVQPHYELSYAQQRLWLLHQLGGASAYNMPEAYRLEADIDAAALERAFQQLVARHEALRTAFVTIEGEPRQKILPEGAFALKRIDLAGEPDPAARARLLADAEASAPFDLAQPPLLRATLLTLGPRQAIFLLTMHHIVGDGWSGNVLYREVFALYAAAKRGEPDPLPPLRIHYKDFAVWQKARGFARDEAYWLRQLAGVPEALRLPYDFAPAEDRDFGGDKVLAEIDAAVTDALRRLARAKQTTLSNVVLAVFELLLFQLTKQEDACIGVSIANRNRAELENLIGFFVNILPVRTRFSEAMEFDELLAQVVTAAEAAFEHQDYPFDLLVQKVNPLRSNNRQPLVNVVYAFQNFADVHVDVGAQRKPTTGGAAKRDAASGEGEEEFGAVRAFEHTFKTSKFDLTLFVADEDGKLALTLEYDTGLFRAETARKWLAGLKRFAGMVAAMAPKD